MHTGVAFTTINIHLNWAVSYHFEKGPQVVSISKKGKEDMAYFDIVLKDLKSGGERSVLVKARTKKEAHDIAATENPSEMVVEKLTKRFQ